VEWRQGAKDLMTRTMTRMMHAKTNHAMALWKSFLATLLDLESNQHQDRIKIERFLKKMLNQNLLKVLHGWMFFVDVWQRSKIYLKRICFHLLKYYLKKAFASFEIFNAPLVSKSELNRQRRVIEDKHKQKAEEISMLVSNLQQMHEAASEQLNKRYEKSTKDMKESTTRLKILLFAEKIIKVAKKIKLLVWQRWIISTGSEDLKKVDEIKSIKVENFKRIVEDHFLRGIIHTWYAFLQSTRNEKLMAKKQHEDRLKLSRFVAKYNYHKHVKLIRQWRKNIIDIISLRKSRDQQIQRVLRFIKVSQIRRRWAVWNESYEALKNIQFARELFGKQIVKCYRNLLKRALMQLKQNVATVREFLASAEMKRRKKEKEARKLHEMKVLADAGQKQYGAEKAQAMLKYKSDLPSKPEKGRRKKSVKEGLSLSDGIKKKGALRHKK
jgi:hypothetical protein